MTTRLLFAVATAVHPEILLVDEVLGAGDAAFQEKAQKRLAEFVEPLAASYDLLEDATRVIRERVGARPEEAGAAAVDYMRLFALTAVGYLFARAAEVSLPKSNDDFHRAKLATARFYFAKLLPETAGLIRTARAGVADRKSVV